MENNQKCNLSGESLNIICASMANAIAQNFDDNDELIQLSLFFTMLGDSLGLIAATRTLCCKSDKEQST